MIALVAAVAIAVPVSVNAAAQLSASAGGASGSKHKPVIMGDYPESNYASAAAQAPAGLATAISRDLHITTAQYLADSAAGVNAAKVVASLKSAGVHVLGEKMVQTKLVVNVASSTDVPAVTAAGATAVIGRPTTPDYSKVVFKAVSATNTYGGEPYFYQEPGQPNGTGYRCSIGFNGYSGVGTPEFVTAGHCETTMSGPAYLINTTAPILLDNSNPGTLGSALGSPVAGQYGGGDDYGIISTSTSYAPQPAVSTWGGGGTTAPVAGTTGSPTTSPLSITGESAVIQGDQMCKSGSTTGWTCGTVLAADISANVSGQTVNAFVSNTCLLPGDSGGAAIMGSSTAIGIDSGGTFNSDCTTSGAESVFFPMVSSNNSNSVSGQQGSNWQLGVPVTSTATVTGPPAGDVVTAGSTLTGTITNPVAASTALLYLDGSTTPFARANASTGSWSIPLTGITLGAHTYAVSAGLGWSPGTPVTGTLQINQGYPVTGAIEVEYQHLGGPTGPFGIAVSPVFTESVNGGGTAQGFQNGSIYQSAAGAFGVSGAIRNAYWAAVGEGGALGWPTAEQVCGLPGAGCSQAFQHGSIYWSTSTGANVVSGAMLTAYLAAGGATGSLGLPTSGLYTESVNGGGTAQGFQNGSMYQSTAGAFPVSGPIRAEYWSVLGEGGSLGWPTAAQVCGLANGGCSQAFQHGSILWTPVDGAKIQ